MKYLLKYIYHLDMFKKCIESMFTVTGVKKRWSLWVCIGCVMFTNLNSCNDKMTHFNLRRELNKLLAQGTGSVSPFKESFPAFCDINSGQISHKSSVNFTTYSLMERIFTAASFNNELLSKKNAYTSKIYWFDSQYYFVLLAIIFKNLCFYC